MRHEKYIAFSREEVGELLQATREPLAPVIPENCRKRSVATRLKEKAVQREIAAGECDFLCDSLGVSRLRANARGGCGQRRNQDEAKRVPKQRTARLTSYAQKMAAFYTCGTLTAAD